MDEDKRAELHKRHAKKSKIRARKERIKNADTLGPLLGLFFPMAFIGIGLIAAVVIWCIELIEGDRELELGIVVLLVFFGGLAIVFLITPILYMKKTVIGFHLTRFIAGMTAPVFPAGTLVGVPCLMHLSSVKKAYMMAVKIKRNDKGKADALREERAEERALDERRELKDE